MYILCIFLNNSFGGLKFGIDSDGNYGYIKAGADSVTPFSSGDLELVHTEFNATNIMDSSYTITKSGNYLLIYQGTHNGIHTELDGYKIKHNGVKNEPILNSGGSHATPNPYDGNLLTIHIFSNVKNNDVISYYVNNWGGLSVNRVFIYQIN